MPVLFQVPTSDRSGYVDVASFVQEPDSRGQVRDGARAFNLTLSARVPSKTTTRPLWSYTYYNRLPVLTFPCCSFFTITPL